MSIVTRGWAAVRVVMVAIWLMIAAAAWWAAPREASLAELRTDIAANRVVSYEWGDSWNGSTRRDWFAPRQLRSTGKQGPLLAWRTPDRRVHWVDTGQFDRVTVQDDARAYEGPGAAGIAAELRAAGLERRDRGFHPYAGLVGGASLLLLLTSVLLVIGGPAPVLGTRWFWFWLVAGLPWGLGMLFWMARERPWRTRPDGDPAKRDKGWRGRVLTIVGGILVGVLLLGINWVAGDWLVPV
jgi:hypothetical protein